MTQESRGISFLREAPKEVSFLREAPKEGSEEQSLMSQRHQTLRANGEQRQSDVLVDLTSGEPRVSLSAIESFVNRYAIAPRWQRICKRAVDIIGASLALILLSPVMIVTAMALSITSRGPILFIQKRVGYNGETFRFLKFRSMCHDAEALRSEFLDQNHHRHGPIFKIEDDPRMTRIGRLMRRLSIDELPQLFHVLQGKMSLVGPRPPLPNEVETYSPRELLRLTVTPGITCIWQVSGRSELDFDTWVDMDLEYIENWSLWLDLELLARTIPAVLSRRGAY